MRDRAGRWAAYSVTMLLYHDSWRQDHPWLLRSPPCFPYGGHQSHGEGSGHSGANHDGSGASFASSTTVSATCLVRVKGCRTNGDARPPIVGHAGGSQGAGKAIAPKSPCKHRARRIHCVRELYTPRVRVVTLHPWPADAATRHVRQRIFMQTDASSYDVNSR